MFLFLLTYLFLFFPLHSQSNSNPYGFLYIDSNSGQSSGGHSALRFGDRVYHLQYSFEDKIFHIIRESWVDFRFQYGVVQNRNIEFYEWEISDLAKHTLRQKWNELYLVQQTHIQNQKKLEEEWETSELNVDGHRFSLPISGFGYFTNIPDPHSPIPKLFSFSKKEKDILKSSSIHWKETAKKIHLTKTEVSLPDTDSPYRLIHSIQTKRDLLTNAEKKRFIRNYLLDPVLVYESAFFHLNGSEFRLSEQEIKVWRSYLTGLVHDLRYCVLESECNDWEEMTLLIRILYTQKSIAEGIIVFPKKNLDGFQYLPVVELPDSVLATKQEEYAKLFTLQKKIFASGYDSIQFFNWESFLVRYQSFLEQGVPPEGIEFNWVGYNPYKENSQNLVISDEAEKQTRLKNYESYTNGIQNLYAYHLTHQNCTTELFRYMNEMFPEGQIGNETFWDPLSSTVSSLNFIPSVAALKLGSNSGTKQRKLYPSYRNLKRKKIANFTEKHFKESFVPTSKIYKQNPIDHPFLFFTEETVWNRPLLGLANTIYGVGYTGMGILSAPFDKGSRFSKGTESVFYSLPELVFFNIRKGHFPFIAAEEIPKEYYLKESL
ncbi:hypothetical protein LEP1GSC195_2548 [Leptospira wolbachii serovar Codice str. CDC]|uniref:PF13387 domain protein n=1 Tax=Leptospira wolbachii serovar Codice str. CDC TaxID=1218599 RepID=R9A089_9LEPT|nr:hypothetical protein [Leptospira wolbachii]EOQ95399.1 hypothetical protein LEP1GSC195_2548 [Leptospira wolbachii serovar Codice str. CDC]